MSSVFPLTHVPSLGLARQPATHERVARRGTERVVGVRPLEDQGLGRERVDVRRDHLVSVAVRLQLGPEVVADDEEDVTRDVNGRVGSSSGGGNSGGGNSGGGKV